MSDSRGRVSLLAALLIAVCIFLELAVPTLARPLNGTEDLPSAHGLSMNLQTGRKLLAVGTCTIVSTDKRFTAYTCGSGAYADRPYAACCISPTSCLSARIAPRSDCSANGIFTSPSCCYDTSSRSPPAYNTRSSSSGDSPSSPERKLLVAGIVAAVIGIVVLSCLGFLLCCLVKKRTKEVEKDRRNSAYVPADRPVPAHPASSGEQKTFLRSFVSFCYRMGSLERTRRSRCVFRSVVSEYAGNGQARVPRSA
ncbi:hypothetical protein KFL_001950050 [Klebsormidium nitens]|uniref:Uncharacterized protein n=1 Tax=Klebsormidium nitens TaxID=105231 RepID=A0A1Y1I3P5_KLENI|nr:hypothetical protein KFL_001950050 [Klebsormidium nitens]|eukprot:GAQ84572.1 hypothetical protein KFL_001950050 [Klebsormidium nitens]